MARPSRASTSTAGPSSSRKSSGGGPRPSTSSRPAGPPTSCTPDYVPVLDREIRELTDEEQLECVTQLMGFPPRKLLFDIHEAANAEIFSILISVEAWLQTRTVPPPQSSSTRTGKGPAVTAEALELEIDTGMHAMETLLTAQMDSAMEKFMAWSYRNAFTVGSRGGVVLPAHEGLDFPRGQYVAEQLPEGERTVDQSIDALRLKVEQKRLLLQTLQKATLKSQHALTKARALSEELAFFKQTSEAYSLDPLPTTLTTLVTSLTTLQIHLAALPPPSSLLTAPQIINAAPDADGQFTLGRAALINRVEERAVAGLGGGDGGGDEREATLDGVEKELEKIGRGIEEEGSE